jgi:hypothetical protein
MKVFAFLHLSKVHNLRSPAQLLEPHLLCVLLHHQGLEAAAANGQIAADSLVPSASAVPDDDVCRSRFPNIPCNLDCKKYMRKLLYSVTSCEFTYSKEKKK